MAPKFGTSGLRGLVVELTPTLVASHVEAFAAACPTGGAIYVGRDMRPSSARIAGDVLAAARRAGLRTVDCGAVPTPALALASMTAGAAAVMVTGSHIPADRNGLKFYIPTGEISKADEAAILAMKTTPADTPEGPTTENDDDVGKRYVRRYVDAFGTDALTGLRIGVYSHSAVGRDLLIDALGGLGAEVRDIARSESFIPVDTEAVDPETRVLLREWARGLDAIVSTDGDGDRPLVADEHGNLVPGDVLGQITATFLGARTVVTPVSSNSGVDRKFDHVIRTRIGSPFVIAGMEGQPDAVGYEANGGFLLGFAAQGLTPLMTRDSLLPIIAPLVMSKGRGLAALVASEPPCFTAADRLTEVPMESAAALLAKLTADTSARTAFLTDLEATEASIDTTDGLRISLADQRIVHIRPSGNAPELRVYTEAKSPEAAISLLTAGLRVVAKWISKEATLHG